MKCWGLGSHQQYLENSEYLLLHILRKYYLCSSSTTCILKRITAPSHEIVPLKQTATAFLDQLLLISTPCESSSGQYRFWVQMFLHTLLVVLTDLTAHLLGSKVFRKHFHLLLSAVVMFGPALSYWVSSHSVFAKRSHFIYRWEHFLFPNQTGPSFALYTLVLHFWWTTPNC